ncbi:MAG: glycosyltransferase family 39 protein [Abditibacteriaceae bacterium]
MPKFITLKNALSWSIVLYVLLTGMLIWRVPLGATPDESAHWDYITYVAENHSLPIFKVTKAPDYGYEFHQPPLYYALNAPLWKVFHGSDAARYAARIFSLICGAFCIFFLWDALKVLFPTRPEIIILTTLFAGLWPLNQTVGASGGNDAMTGLISVMLLWVIVKGAFDGWSWRHSIWLGILAGIGILTKSSCLLPAFAAFGGAVHLLWRGHNNNPNGKNTFAIIVPQIGLAFLLTLVIGGWWLMRNQTLYGDPLAMGVFQKAFAKSSPSPFLFFAVGVGVFTYLRALLSISFCTFWGLFGGPNTALQVLNPFGSTGAKPVALLALPPALIFLCATIFGIWGVWGKLRDGMDKGTLRRVAITWWMIEFAMVIFSWVEFNITQFQGQARYIHPAMLPIVAGLCYGWVIFWGTKDKKLSVASAVVGIAMIAVTLWNILGWRTLV